MTSPPTGRPRPAGWRDRLRRHLRLIEDGVRPVTTRYAAQIRCAPGCSDCCHQSFRVSALEGALLREGLAALPPEPRAEVRARAAAYRPDQREPCPALSDDGRCRLYAHRPRICRKYGIPLWHPDRPHEVRCCPLNFKDMGDIDAALILDPQATWAEDWLRLREELGEPPAPDRTIAQHLLEDDTHHAPAVGDLPPGDAPPEDAPPEDAPPGDAPPGDASPGDALPA